MTSGAPFYDYVCDSSMDKMITIVVVFNTCSSNHVIIFLFKGMAKDDKMCTDLQTDSGSGKFKITRYYAKFIMC